MQDEHANKSIAVLIPCYNEAVTIAKVVDDFKRCLPEADIYVYDNNSTDETASIAQAHGAIVRSEPRQGKGNVVRQMLRDVSADYYLMVDGDDTYPVENAREMARMVLEEKTDMVIGDRLSATYFEENKRPLHDSGNRLVRSIINRIFHSDVKDIMTGYRAMSRRLVETLPLLSEGFEIETEMTIMALDSGLDIRHIPVQYRDRPDGSVSKLNTITDGCRILLTILKLYRDYQPLRFFSMIAALLVVIATIVLIPVLTEYFQTGLVPRYPTLIVCGFVILFAMMMWVCGIVLEVMLAHQRQLRELIVKRK
jgi:glycosyltransferase involved in cell wall biosynthesis